MAQQILTADLLLNAYTMGVFPMAESRDDPEVFWVDPRRRGIMPLDGLHISRSLARTLRRGGFRIEVNKDFEATVAACADRPETWINQTIFDLYLDLHARGLAHSLEVHANGLRGDTLIGGIYGICIAGAFFGESMFSRRPDASKIALAFLVDRLQQGGFQLFDTQFITPHLQRMGAIEISRLEYHRRLRMALRAEARFEGFAAPETGHDLLQRRTHTS